MCSEAFFGAVNNELTVKNVREIQALMEGSKQVMVD